MAINFLAEAALYSIICYTTTMKAESKPISEKQMSSMHIYYREIAEQLNEAGFDIQRAIDMVAIRISVGFTEENVKSIFGKAVIESLFPDKDSHTRLSTTQTQMVYETLNLAIAERFGISIPFPEKVKDE